MRDTHQVRRGGCRNDDIFQKSFAVQIRFPFQQPRKPAKGVVAAQIHPPLRQPYPPAPYLRNYDGAYGCPIEEIFPTFISCARKYLYSARKNCSPQIYIICSPKYLYKCAKYFNLRGNIECSCGNLFTLRGKLFTMRGKLFTVRGNLCAAQNYF